MSVMVIRRDRHIPRETEIGRFFRRELNCPAIFTFWNAERSMWVLAYWLDPSETIMDEIEDLGHDFEDVTQGFVAMIRAGWGVGIDWGAHKKRLLARQAGKIQKENESIYQAQEEWDWVKKKHRARYQNELPYAIDVGVPGPQTVHTTGPH